ncbi:MAG: M48 family metallopeptidase [Chloroflexi bacterium]|nr:M48 family metallopeptidase [Chloroflexota bacterium]
MEIRVIRSEKRHSTVSARLEHHVLVVRIPAACTTTEEALYVDRMRARFEQCQLSAQGDLDLQKRAAELNTALFGGTLPPFTIRYVDNQRWRWGSCTPATGEIRLARELIELPRWVADYVVVHELAHLLQPTHNRQFWKLASRYELAERARGYLLAIHDQRHGSAGTPPTGSDAD